MKSRLALALAACGIVFIAGYKLAAWQLFSGRADIAEECATGYGGIAVSEMTDFIQTKKETCGQAAVAFFLTGIGFPETEASIIDETGKESMLSLVDMGRIFTSRGLKVQTLKVEPKYFKKHPAAAILHLSSLHYVVFLGEDFGEPEIFDPVYGRVFVPWKTLLRMFSGYMVYVYK